MDNTLDLARIPKEVNLILALLKEGNEQYIKEHQVELCNKIDWNAFINQAKHHRVYPLLHNKIKLLEEQLVPTYVRQFLQQQYMQNTFQMLHLSGEMERVSKWFAESQISLLFLKGPVLAHELYGDVSLRTSSDLDMLIPVEKIDQAEQLLVSHGYKKDDYIQTVLNDWKWRHHHVTYIHPVKNIKLEIHWRLNPGPSKEPGFCELWKRKNKSTLTSFPVYLLGKEDLFLFLVSHGSRHGWSRLRWVVDIHRIMKQDINWEMVHELLKSNYFLGIGGQSIILASKLLNAQLTNEMKSLFISKRPRKLAQEAIFYLEAMINLHTDPVPDEVARYHKRYLFSLMSFQQKTIFIISFLYPYPEDAETLPLPKRLHFLYFPLRPILWAWRKTRKIWKHALP
ncbi:nucleotidyltransferase domain-containing protein [Virgibacillus necropolis]|uniref:Renal dipeptidase n=1 Tax=Virgibacillus necropolis TaxID=163877 RepID=A0A221MEI4_9BACI|nr:nucleotidyltransferase family protein [Virgibacillus necropolis]ASN05979.1 Renal dipeptidase [Virgibacillus necropolis]